MDRNNRNQRQKKQEPTGPPFAILVRFVFELVARPSCYCHSDLICNSRRVRPAASKGAPCVALMLRFAGLRVVDSLFVCFGGDSPPGGVLRKRTLCPFLFSTLRNMMCCVRVLGIYSALLVEREEYLARRSCLRAVRNNLGTVLICLLFLGSGRVGAPFGGYTGHERRVLRSDF